MTAGASRLKQLIAVAKEGSGEKRRDLLRAITDVFMTTPGRFTASEMQHFDVIMSRLAGQADAALRRELAEKLAPAPSAPPTLMRQLAHDEISVAEPVLKRSRALTEEDLVGIVRRRDQEHMRAIAKRRTIPETLTAELAAAGDETVLISLAENRGAKFSDDAMEKMVGHAQSLKSLQKPMTDRFDLPAKLLTRMYFFVSAEVKKEILKRSDMLDPALIDEAIKANRRQILKDAGEGAQPDVAAAHQFLQEKDAANQINESLLNELMDMKQPAEFLLAFSHIIGVDRSTAQALMQDKTWESLAIACRAAGLERETFARVVLDLQKNPANQNRALQILDLYLKIPQEAAERMMRFWRVRPQAAAAVAANDAAAQSRRPKLHEIGQRIAG